MKKILLLLCVLLLVFVVACSLDQPTSDADGPSDEIDADALEGLSDEEIFASDEAVEEEESSGIGAGQAVATKAVFDCRNMGDGVRYQKSANTRAYERSDITCESERGQRDGRWVDWSCVSGNEVKAEWNNCEEARVVESCEDSDGTRPARYQRDSPSSLIAGEAYLTYTDGTEDEGEDRKQDFCYRAGSPWLREHHCSNNQVERRWVRCEDECSEGACVVEPVCGDGVVDEGEQCDSVEGCSVECVANAGYQCSDNVCQITIAAQAAGQVIGQAAAGGSSSSGSGSGGGGGAAIGQAAQYCEDNFAVNNGERQDCGYWGACNDTFKGVVSCTNAFCRDAQDWSTGQRVDISLAVNSSGRIDCTAIGLRCQWNRGVDPWGAYCG